MLNSKVVLSVGSVTGISKLIPVWRRMLKKEGLREDLIAGLTVGCVSIPLSLAIALASGMEPGTGLITAIVASIVAALFGGTELAVSGPAAAMSILIAASVKEFGVAGLALIGFFVGLLQVISGMFKLGRFVRFMPGPVIAGFTAGIGAIILLGQLPRAMGLKPPTEGNAFQAIQSLVAQVGDTNFWVVGVALMTIILGKILPRISNKLPSPLLAVAVPTILVAVLGIEVPLIGNIPERLPTPSFPDFSFAMGGRFVETVLLVFALASLETLLSSMAVDKLSKKDRHDSDQELIGQGLANLSVSFFAGIPVTGVIARSALNVRSGGRTRRSAIVHALLILLSVYFLAPLITRIPIAALAGMLVSVALNMLHPRELVHIWKVSKLDTVTYWVTLGVMLALDLVMGVQAGIIASLIIAAIYLGRTRVELHWKSEKDIQGIALSGPITFLSSARFENLGKQILSHGECRGVILDLSQVNALDSSGAQLFVEFVTHLRNKKIQVLAKGLSKYHREVILKADPSGSIKDIFVVSECEVQERLEGATIYDARQRLLFGIEKYHRGQRNHYEELFDKLKESQKPHTLFITCSDSRINPNLITSSDPGELFIVRNVGNMLPAYGTDDTPAEGAAVEYALGVLGVSEVIICGHIGCGAMQAVYSDADLSRLPSVRRWLQGAYQMQERFPEIREHEKVVRLNVIQQVKNLMTYPMVREKLAAKKLKIRGWIYDLRKGHVIEWTPSGKGVDLLYPIPDGSLELQDWGHPVTL